jgi:fructokinase
MEELHESDQRLDLFALGEALVDLISSEAVSSLEEASQFERFLGGQPTNLALNMAKMGLRSGLAACVGEDGFGRFIQDQIKTDRVSIDCLQITEEAPTSVAIITRGIRTADFLIARGADFTLKSTPAIEIAAANSRIVHTSAFGLSRDPARTTILKALKIAKQSGALVSLDPNYHPKIWPDDLAFTEILKSAYQYVAISKPSLDDSVRIFGPGHEPTAYARRFLDWGCEIVVLTMGAKGLLLALSSGEQYQIEANAIPVADSTGAGDAFWAGFLAAILDGAPPVDAARMGQVLAEVKLGAVGPMKDLPDSDYLRRRSADISIARVDK